MQARIPVSHARYTGSSGNDGYPGGDEHDSPVDRLAYAIYPLSVQLSGSAEYDRRVLRSKVILVPDISVYSARDNVVIPGSGSDEDRTYFVTQPDGDFSFGPFGFKPGSDATAFGQIVVEKVTG